MTKDVRWELAAALRTFGRLGYEFGFNGHVSVRAPQVPGHYWVNPFGVSISAVTPADLVLVDPAGQVVSPETAARINGFAGNLRLHTEVPDAAAVIHLHTPHGFVWSSLGERLEAVNTDSALVVGLQGLTSTLWGDADAPTTVDLAREGARVLVQRGHGFVTLGRSVAEAAFYLVAAERAAGANLALRGDPARGTLDDDAVKRWTLTPELAEQHFAPYFGHPDVAGLR